MASFTQNPSPTNDPTYLNYAQDLDKPKPNTALSTAIEGISNTAGAAAKAGYNILTDKIEEDARQRIEGERNAAGVDLTTEAAAAGVPVGNTKGDPANTLFGDGSEGERTKRPPGFDRFETRMAALKQKYEEGGLSDTYYYGRLEAHVREMRAKWGDHLAPEIDAAVKKIAGVDPANALRKSIQSDYDRAEKAAKSQGSREETFINQNLEYMSKGTLTRWQKKQVPFAAVQAEVADRQRDKALVAEDKARIELKKARGEQLDDDDLRTATREVNIATRQRMTEFLDDSGGLAKVQEFINSKRVPTPQEAESLRVTMVQAKANLENDLRRKLNDPVYDRMKPHDKDKLVADSLQEVDNLEKNLTNKDNGLLHQNAIFLEAQKDRDMRVILEKNDLLRKTRVLRELDPSGNLINVMLRDTDKGGFLEGIQKAGKMLAGTNLATGEGTISDNIRNINEAGKDGENTRVLAKPEMVRTQLRDVKNLIVEAAKNPDPTALRNIAKGAFGPGQENFIKKFAPDSQLEVFTTLSSPNVTQAMLKLKDTDPASWNMYTKSVTHSFNTVFRKEASDLRRNASDWNRVVDVAWNQEQLRFDVTLKTDLNNALVPRDFKERIARDDNTNPLNIANKLNTALSVLKPLIQANGGDANKAMQSVLQSMNLDPNNPQDKPFFDTWVKPLFRGETDPNKNPYVFNDLSRQGQKDEARTDEGTISFGGKVGEPDDVQHGIMRVIRKAEAGGGSDSYKRVFGSRNPYPLTDMTVDQVMGLQSQMRGAGSPSTAVGAYQFLNKTLSRLKTEMGLAGDEKFDTALQDKMAIALMKGRGYDDWQEGKITRKQFVDRLAMEWAGLPNTSGKSHYDGDGLNRSTIRLRELLDVLPRPEKGQPEAD